MIKFLRESYEELKLVKWPTRNEAIKLTGIVVGLSVFVSIFVASADFVYTRLLELVIK